MENGQNYECDGFSTFPPGGVRGAIGISAYVMQFDWSNAHCALIKYVLLGSKLTGPPAC